MSNSGGQAPALIASGDSLAAPTALPVDAFAYILDDTSSTWRRFLSARSLGDGDAGAYYPAVASRLKAGGNYDVARTPNVFKVGVASALGATTAWTPTAGKKFRLMRYQIVVTQNAVQAAAGINAIRFLDGGAGFNVGVDAFVPNAAGTTLGGFNTGWVDLGNGYLSTAANNVLAINLATALTGGEVFALLAGTEE